MANGDAASAAGMAVVAGTADRRLGYDEINKTRDYLAEHLTNGTHPASKITGVMARAQLPGLESGAGTVFWDSAAWIIIGNVGVSGGLNANGPVNIGGQITNPTAYGSVVSSGRTLAVRADGTFGYFPSARRFKENFASASIDPAALLDDRAEPQEFDWKVEFGGTHDFGFPAENIAELFPFLAYNGDEDGQVDGYDKAGLVIPLISTVRWLAARLEKIEAKLAAQ